MSYCAHLHVKVAAVAARKQDAPRAPQPLTADADGAGLLLLLLQRVWLYHHPRRNLRGPELLTH